MIIMFIWGKPNLFLLDGKLYIFLFIFLFLLKNVDHLQIKANSKKFQGCAATIVTPIFPIWNIKFIL
uniref:Unkown protein n=1 Tax=Riptortus pedestris TaxID=329032 RepID=R4WDY5_RIPPE|nr:unkown protein [Riptortus pedestris]